MDGSGDHDARKLQPVVPTVRLGLIRNSRTVKRCKQKIPASVAGEHAARSVSSVSSGSKSNNESIRFGIAKVWRRLGPVGLIPKGGTLRSRYKLAPFDESWALTASDKLAV